VKPCSKTKEWSSRETQDFEYEYAPVKVDFDRLRIHIEYYNKPTQIVNTIGPSHLSNIFKWGQMATEGGLYSDMDLLWVKPIPEDFYDHDTIICYEKWWSIGFLGSSGQNQFYQDIFHQSLRSYDPKQYQCLGVKTLRQVCRDPKHINEKYPSNRVLNLPFKVVYPWDYNNLDNIFESVQTLPEETIGIHWYAGAAKAQEWNRRLTEDNWRQHTNTFTEKCNELYSSSLLY
jgi:hypothetical protein